MATPTSIKMAERKLTDAALAEKVGVDRSTITRIKLGKARPSLDLAVKLSSELGLNAGDFLPQQAGAA